MEQLYLRRAVPVCTLFAVPSLLLLYLRFGALCAKTSAPGVYDALLVAVAQDKYCTGVSDAFYGRGSAVPLVPE